MNQRLVHTLNLPLSDSKVVQLIDRRAHESAHVIEEDSCNRQPRRVQAHADIVQRAILVAKAQ